jgi:hypothetical protein
VIFALDREAAPFRRLARRHRLPVRILVSGVGATAARKAMESVGEASLVISAGYCGALDPYLKIGDVRCSDETKILTVDHLVATPDAKRRLRAETGADIVDMEAEPIRRLCESRNIPFLAVKAVSDTAGTALSPALVNLLSAGRVAPFRALAAAIRRPALLLEFRHLARDTRIAAERLAEHLVAIVQKSLAPV